MRALLASINSTGANTGKKRARGISCPYPLLASPACLSVYLTVNRFYCTSWQLLRSQTWRESERNFAQSKREIDNEVTHWSCFYPPPCPSEGNRDSDCPVLLPATETSCQIIIWLHGRPSISLWSRLPSVQYSIMPVGCLYNMQDRTLNFTT